MHVRRTTYTLVCARRSSRTVCVAVGNRRSWSLTRLTAPRAEAARPSVRQALCVRLCASSRTAAALRAARHARGRCSARSSACATTCMRRRCAPCALSRGCCGTTARRPPSSRAACAISARESSCPPRHRASRCCASLPTAICARACMRLSCSTARAPRCAWTRCARRRSASRTASCRCSGCGRSYSAALIARVWARRPRAGPGLAAVRRRARLAAPRAVPLAPCVGRRWAQPWHGI